MMANVAESLSLPRQADFWQKKINNYMFPFMLRDWLLADYTIGRTSVTFCVMEHS